MELKAYLEKALELSKDYVSKIDPEAYVAITTNNEYIGLMAKLETPDMSIEVFHPVCPEDRYSGRSGVITMMSGDPNFAASQVHWMVMERICKAANRNYQKAPRIDVVQLLSLLSETQKWRNK